jgi:hypothetical protein
MVPELIDRGGGVTSETWYVGGSGVLIRSGRHLLLLGGRPPADFLDRCWDVVTGPGDVAAQLLALVDKEHPQSPLVLLDLTPGSLHRVVRGADVVDDGTTRRVRLDPTPALGTWLPLEGGIVAAGAVEIRVPAAALPATGIIDGIPAELLREMAESPTSEPPEPSVACGTATRSAPDEPHTVRRAPTDPDHDGATVHHRVPPGQRRASLPQATGDTVLAMLCPRGHVTSAVAPLCRVCCVPVADQVPNRIPRPSLGALRLPTGERVPLDRSVLLGRRPATLGDEPAKPHLVHLPPDNAFVSRMHLRIELDGWLVVARDLGSRGGTTWKVPGRAPERMRANEPYLLEPGHALDLADSYEIVFEVTP